MTPNHRFASAAAAIVLTCGLAACGSDENGTAGGSGTEGSPSGEQTPASAMGEITDQHCAPGPSGAYSLRATITNSGEAAMAYTVTAYVALVNGGTVQGAGESTEVVQAGESVEFVMEDFYTYGGDSEVDCVLAVTKVPAA